MDSLFLCISHNKKLLLFTAHGSVNVKKRTSRRDTSKLIVDFHVHFLIKKYQSIDREWVEQVLIKQKNIRLAGN